METERKPVYFITGSTGLIGRTLIKRLAGKGHLVLFVRNLKKARSLFEGIPDVEYVTGDVTGLVGEDWGADYIIHLAALTSSYDFINNPVGVIAANVKGTENVLMTAVANKATLKKMIFFSTMEIYGQPQTEDRITEDYPCSLDVVNPRSGYPESKRLCENMCAAYHSQYGVPVTIARLTQTFGPGVENKDGRVFAEFMRCAAKGEDLVLHTTGETKRSYLYTEDAVDAIMLLLEKGEPGQAYNVANEETYCSILDMAKLVADDIAKGSIKVKVEPEEDAAKRGYAPKLFMNLDTSKVKALGFVPKTGLKEMYEKTIEAYHG